jgi:Family of unknown function (DUF5335)
MSTMRNLPKTEWRGFFDRMSKPLLGKWAEIEVAELDLGDQVIAEWVPLIGITYDSQDDLLDVALDRANRLIRHPREIVVEEAEAGLASVAVVDADGARHIVRLKEPLTLPPGAEAQ